MPRKSSFVPYRPGAFGAETAFLAVMSAGQAPIAVVENQFGQLLHAESRKLLEGLPGEMEGPLVDP